MLQTHTHNKCGQLSNGAQQLLGCHSISVLVHIKHRVLIYDDRVANIMEFACREPKRKDLARHSVRRICLFGIEAIVVVCPIVVCLPPFALKTCLGWPWCVNAVNGISR